MLLRKRFGLLRGKIPVAEEEILVVEGEDFGC